MAGVGWIRPQKRGFDDGASVVQIVKMGFCKRGFGKRNYRSLERALRGEEDGMVGGDQGGVGGGRNGGEANGEMGCFGKNKKKKKVVKMVL